MEKPPAGNIPGMTDTLDFVKKLWGSMSVPGAGTPGMSGIPGMSSLSGMVSPALTVEDLDKRIADLKAVEGWLNVNLSMLRGTIQTMEVQRSTLATIKSMGASMAEAMRQSGVSADKMANMPFAPFFGQGMQGAAPAAAAAAPAPAPAKPNTPPAGNAAQPSAGAAEVPGAAAAMPAAIAWWNMLQEQFAQAVTTAMAPAPAATPAADTNADADAGTTAKSEAPSEDNAAAPANGRPRTRSRSDKS